MCEWRTTTIADISESVNRGISPTYVVDGVPVINQKCIRDGRIDTGLAKFTAPAKVLNSKKILKAGDILINSTGVGTAGRVGMFKNAAITTTDSHVTILRLDPTRASSAFVFYNLRRREDEIEGICEGSTGQIELSRSRFSSLELLLPPLSEQRSIAEVLCSLDDKIDLLHRNNQSLEQMAEALFRQWFIEEENPEWSKVVLGDHLTVVRGLSYKGSGLTDRTDVSAVPMVNLNSIREGGGFKHEGLKYYNGDYKQRHILRPGDIVLANTEQGHEYRLIGYTAMVPRSVGETAIFSQHVFKIAPKDDDLPPIFLVHLLSAPKTREQILGATNGTTVNMLSAVGIEKAVVSLPVPEKRHEYERIVTPFFRKRDANDIQIFSLENLRDALLPKLMSGELRVKNQ